MKIFLVERVYLPLALSRSNVATRFIKIVFCAFRPFYSACISLTIYMFDEFHKKKEERENV